MKTEKVPTILATLAMIVFLIAVALPAASADFLGAREIQGSGVPLQEAAAAVAPLPSEARFDKGRAFADHCLVGKNQVHSKKCTYGNKRSKTTAVLLGDSKAMQYFAALEPIALRRNWRLVVLTRADCFVGDLFLDKKCWRWRKNTYKRMARKEHPDIVFLGTSTKYYYHPGEKWKVGDLSAALVRSIRKIRAMGSKVVVMRDQSVAPYDRSHTPGDCVEENMDNLQECAWSPRETRYPNFEVRAARKTGVPVIDPQSHVCRPNICPLVIGNVIVTRDDYHYSATFARTLSPWLDSQIEQALR